jgi:hypothetical protein
VPDGDDAGHASSILDRLEVIAGARRGRSRRVCAVPLVALTACGSPDPAPVAEALNWPATWELVGSHTGSDSSCGAIRCPTAVRYFRVADAPAAACDRAAGVLGTDPRPHQGGCTLDRCEDDVFVTVSVTDDVQRVQEGVGQQPVEAPPGGAAVAVQARGGC